VAEFERVNAKLRAELGQSHIKIAEMEERQNSLCSSYDQLNNEYRELHDVAKSLQWEKADVEKTSEAQVTKARADFQKYRVQHRRRLRDLYFDLEGVLGELGAQCLPYPGKGSTIGDIGRWFEGEVKSLPATFARANKNFACFAIAGVLRMLQEYGCEHLSGLHPLASSNDASLYDMPT
jgi:hypothetical protein